VITIDKLKVRLCEEEKKTQKCCSLIDELEESQTGYLAKIAISEENLVQVSDGAFNNFRSKCICKFQKLTEETTSCLYETVPWVKDGTV